MNKDFDKSKIPPPGTMVTVIHEEPYLGGQRETSGKVLKVFDNGFLTPEGRWDFINRCPEKYRICQMVLIEVAAGTGTESRAFALTEISDIKVIKKGRGIDERN